MATWPSNWNVVRHDRVVGSCPREPSDLDALQAETGASAVLSLQSDECLAKLGIDDPAHVRHGQALGLTLVRAPLRDFDPADRQRGLPAAVRGLWGLLRQGHRVYVHCTYGLNRAPLVAAAYLMLIEGLEWQAVRDLVNHARPDALPHWGVLFGGCEALTAQYAARIHQRAEELSPGAAPDAEVWQRAERDIWREVLTAG